MADLGNNLPDGGEVARQTQPVEHTGGQVQDDAVADRAEQQIVSYNPEQILSIGTTQNFGFFTSEIMLLSDLPSLPHFPSPPPPTMLLHLFYLSIVDKLCIICCRCNLFYMSMDYSVYSGS